LPAGLAAAVLVVQHMPPRFTRSLAERLDAESALPVREAADGDTIAAGQVLVAPGGYHMTVTPVGTIALNREPTLWGVRPAADPMLRTAAARFGSGLVAAILTGMGHDGRDGCAAVRCAGGRVIAEDESTCVVYGMPRAVAEAGQADEVVPLYGIAGRLAELVAR
jgi:two-component system, chemotaxis family, protein-glutamate methylesterase/glutaminase